jgi:YVTN family beta-propeller protein
VVATVGVGAGPDGVAYDGGNGYVYVANSGSDTVSLISGTTVVATVGVGSAPEGVAYDDGNGYVYVVNSGSDTVSVISGTTVVATVSVGSAPRGVAYDGGNGYVYVANFGPSTVSVISGTTVVATVSVGSGPDGVAYDGGNGYVYVTDHSASTVSVISGTTVVATVSVGSEPFGVGYDGGNGDVYVPNYGTSNVSVLATSWASGFAPTLTIDVEQNLFLIAPLVFLNPGVTGVSATTSSTSGLDCTALSATLTNVSMGCTAMAPGVYTATLTVTGTLGNSVWTSATVTVSSDPVVSVPSPTRQAADVGQTILFSTLASGGPGTYVAYAWSAPSALGCVNSTSNTLSCVPTAPIVAGTVSVNVTDGNNMTSLTASRAYNVSADPTISAPSATRSTLDVGQSTVLSVTATNGTGLPSVYTWQGLPPSCPSVNAPSIRCAPTVAGTYIVSASIEDSNGLTVSSGSLVLVVSPPLGTPTLAGSASALDVGQSVTFVASVSGGEAPYAYVWEGLPSGCASVDAATVTCSPTGAGVSTVAVTVTDANGVVGSSASFDLTVSPRLVGGSLSLTPAVIDLGQGIEINVTVSGGSAGLTYAWSGLPSGCAGTGAKVDCTPGAAGTSWISVEVTDGNGEAVRVGPTPLTVNPALGAVTVSESTSSLELGGSVAFTASVTGGTGPLAYSWSGLPSGCASVNSPVVLCVPAQTGRYAVSVKVTDGTGASVTATGAPVSVSGAPSPGSGSGTNGLEWAVLGLALVALVIGGVALVLLLRKDRRAPPGVGTGDTRSAGEPVPKEPEVGKGEVGEGDKE